MRIAFGFEVSNTAESFRSSNVESNLFSALVHWLPSLRWERTRIDDLQGYYLVYHKGVWCKIRSAGKDFRNLLKWNVLNARSENKYIAKQRFLKESGLKKKKKGSHQFKRVMGFVTNTWATQDFWADLRFFFPPLLAFSSIPMWHLPFNFAFHTCIVNVIIICIHFFH